MFWKTMLSVALTFMNVFFQTVTARPVLETTPLNITAKRGFSVTLPCSIQDLGTHRVMWMSQYNVAITLDDRIILPDSRYSLARTYDKDWGLVINNVKPTDEGVYKCVVHSYPILEKPISLIVLVSPTIDSQMTSNNMAVSEMDDVTLRCHVSGNPKPDITWYRQVSGPDHETLAREHLDQTGNILNIPEITRHSAGEYICHASNGIEPGASKTISVDVLYAPEIQTMMRNMGQYLGRDSALECTAEGSPIPDMKWYINGQRLTDSWKFKTTNYAEPLDGVVTSALLIRNIDRIDYRVYTCEAANAHGTALHNITVFPLGAPGVIVDQSSRSMIVQEGTEVDLECFASGTPSPTVTWSKDDGQTEIGPGTVTLTSVQGSDAGTYTCFAENPLGSDTLSIQIDVEYPPTVLVPISEADIAPGESASINCTVRGRPQPQMSWRKEGSSDDKVVKITEVDESTWIMVFRIDSVTSEDFGTYICEAVNSANSSSGSIGTYRNPDNNGSPHSRADNNDDNDDDDDDDDDDGAIHDCNKCDDNDSTDDDDAKRQRTQPCGGDQGDHPEIQRDGHRITIRRTEFITNNKSDIDPDFINRHYDTVSLVRKVSHCSIYKSCNSGINRAIPVSEHFTSGDRSKINCLSEIHFF